MRGVHIAGELCRASKGLTSQHVIQLKGGVFIDAAKHFMGMMNDIEHNNAKVRESGGVFARRFIGEGDEICTPYGASYWRVHRRG